MGRGCIPWHSRWVRHTINGATVVAILFLTAITFIDRKRPKATWYIVANSVNFAVCLACCLLQYLPYFSRQHFKVLVGVIPDCCLAHFPSISAMPSTN